MRPVFHFHQPTESRNELTASRTRAAPNNVLEAFCIQEVKRKLLEGIGTCDSVQW
jgi:hypothetical protein